MSILIALEAEGRAYMEAHPEEREAFHRHCLARPMPGGHLPPAPSGTSCPTTATVHANLTLHGQQPTHEQEIAVQREADGIATSEVAGTRGEWPLRADAVVVFVLTGHPRRAAEQAVQVIRTYDNDQQDNSPFLIAVGALLRVGWPKPIDHALRGGEGGGARAKA